MKTQNINEILNECDGITENDTEEIQLRANKQLSEVTRI
jgi:hypothetical protein